MHEAPKTGSSPPLEKCGMVGWYDPLQLIRTAGDVAASTLFGRHADYRLLEALATRDPSCEKIDMPPTGDLWIDYVADVGDGWNPTYAIAHAIAQEDLTLRAPDRTEHATHRGRILIFGGDEVYPVASRGAYRIKTLAPYSAALPTTDTPHPVVRAVAGNHDWYDSLVSFTRLFSRDWFGGWQAGQSRSYFSIELPHGWWLLGTDVQLGSDIDPPQVDYFRAVARQMKEGDRVILCNAEPHWIYAHIYGALDSDFSDNNLAFLEAEILSRKVAVFLAGDLHHYRRHQADDGTQKITAGGGGAFLHPTHGPNVDMLDGGYRLMAAFPTPADSRGLGFRNLLFPFWNPWFGVVSGMLYMLTAWSTLTDLSSHGLRDFSGALAQAVNAALINPTAVFWLTALFLGFLLFTDTHSKTYRVVAGSVHGFAHLTATFLIGWGVTVLTVSHGLPFKSTVQLLLGGALIVAAGWIAGSFIMGIYLLVSLNVFGRHTNEAFSSLKIQDWKNFLRLRIDGDGTLTIYPIGIRRVPRKWSARADGTPGSRFIGDDPAATLPELIEAPITIGSAFVPSSVVRAGYPPHP